jgi:hypothetical protein
MVCRLTSYASRFEVLQRPSDLAVSFRQVARVVNNHLYTIPVSVERRLRGKPCQRCLFAQAAPPYQTFTLLLWPGCDPPDTGNEIAKIAIEQLDRIYDREGILRQRRNLSTNPCPNRWVEYSF